MALPNDATNESLYQRIITNAKPERKARIKQSRLISFKAYGFIT